MKKIYTAAAVLILACSFPVLAAEPAAAGQAAVAAGPTPEQALSRLLEGNQRFVKGEARHAGAGPERRAELIAGQKPFAAVLTCSDSRVPPELLFDQGLGEIFAVRVAGNVAGVSEQGSIEYAAEHLGVPVIMVLGHTGCGAVTAAVKGGKAEGALGSILKQIEPAVKAARAHGASGEALTPAAVEENVRLTAKALLRRNSVVRGLVAEGKLKVSAGVYDLATGEVRLLDMEKDLRAERAARAASLKGLLKKMKAGEIDENERVALYDGVVEFMDGLK